MGLLHHPFGFSLYLGTFRHKISTISNYFVWPRITDRGSVPEMRIWSILLIKSDLKWCIHLSRSLFLYLGTDVRPELLAPDSLKYCGNCKTYPFKYIIDLGETCTRPTPTRDHPFYTVISKHRTI